MQMFLQVALAILYAFTSCNAEECDCYPEDILESITEISEFRDAWNFFDTSQRLYLLRISLTVSLMGKQCIIIERSLATFPKIVSKLTYIDSLKPPGQERQTKVVTLTMKGRSELNSKSTYFSTKDLPGYGESFPVVYWDSKCMIFLLTSEAYGRRGCAFLVKESERDKPLEYCKIIFRFFCGENYQRVYMKYPCDELLPNKEN
uniref:Putative salivary lipocalin n=1 Tax=Ixodes ricinus TaxID=34613 RepID=A0A0K8R8H9_IXORI